MDSRLDGLPADALAFVQDELQAGNALLDVMRPPPDIDASVYVMLARPCRRPPPEPDAAGWFFGHRAPGVPAVVVLGAAGYPSDPVPEPEPAADTTRLPALQRFECSRVIDDDAWREGSGYDLDAIDEALPEQRALMLERLLDTDLRDWRDIQAVDRIGGRAARRALRCTWRHGTVAQRMAMLRHAPDRVTGRQRVAALVEALAEALLYEGLSECLDEVQDCHPAEVIQALWAALERPEAEVTVHCAAMLTHLHGLADDPFDWDQRPFFLRFGSDEPAERQAARTALRRRILTHGHPPRTPLRSD